MPTIIIHKLALCDAAPTVYPVSVASSGACISNGRICSNSITVYLSEAVYRPGDLGKIYDKAAVPPVSKPKAAPPAWLQPINKAYDLIPPTGTLNAVGHILAHKRELRVNIDPVFSVAWHRYPKDRGKPGLYYSPTGSVEGGEIAKRLSGDGPEQADIVDGLTPIYQRALMITRVISLPGSCVRP